MMTHELEVSILAAPLAAIDRRALSQAWYDALHVAQATPQKQPRVSQAVASAVATPVAAALRPAPFPMKGPPSGVPARSPVQRGRDPGRGIPVDSDARSRAHSALSRRIERRFATPAQPVARATFSFGRGTARVHIIMQSNGSTARLIAICRPRMRDVVSRALAEARLALGARGIVAAAPTRSSRSAGCI